MLNVFCKSSFKDKDKTGMNVSDKMYHIAKELDELNKDGKVKGFSGNEKGYAKVLQIVRGCSLWVHHEKDDRLLLDLVVSPAAKRAFPTKCDKSIDKFKELFGFSLKKSNWKHSIDNHNDHERYYVVITELDLETIIELITKIKTDFALNI